MADASFKGLLLRMALGVLAVGIVTIALASCRERVYISDTCAWKRHLMEKDEICKAGYVRTK